LTSLQTRSHDRPAWSVDDAAFDAHLQSARFKQMDDGRADRGLGRVEDGSTAAARW
jgi:hypothetical protein